MFRKISDFLQSHAYLTEATIRVFEQLTDENLDQPVATGYRTLGDVAWHIVVTIPEMMGRTGLPLSAVDQHAMPPTSAREIRDGYAAASAELRKAVESEWGDETLLETDDMYGERWPRGMSLTSLIHHEIHHRGQMTVLLRQAGAPVPGVFGPSKEEWAQFGGEPPAY